MDDTLVSSRIPRAKKEVGVAALENIGSTTSELINSAFNYVIEHGALPDATPPKRPTKKSFERFVAQSTLSINWENETRSDKDILQQRLVADYESLA